MPDYKVIDAGKLDSDLARIADVIREKSGVTAKLDFPDAYINVLNGLLTRIPMSEGLEYVLNDDRAGYTVTGLGTCTDTDIIIPPIYEGLPVTSIGSYAFQSCSGLTSITIPNSVTSIDRNAFRSCSGLTSVTIGNSVTSIGSYAFQSCSGLTSITIPNSVTSIGDYAFTSCSGLTSVTIGNSVTSIGWYAFQSCSGLTTIIVDSQNTVYHSAGNCLIETSSKTLIAGCKNSVIPDDGSVTSIGYGAFYGCPGLTSITIPDNVTSIGSYAFQGCSGLTSITIPNGVTSIGYRAFYYCNSLTSVKIGNNVTSIGDYSFRGCTGLTSITIPDSVTSIGSYAFQSCSGLRSITLLSRTPPTAGFNVFANCTNLAKIIVLVGCGDAYNSATNWSNYADIEEASIGLAYTLINDGTAYSVTGLGTCTDTDVIIPSMYEGLPVTSIGSYAFQSCSGLTSITIPNSVTSIDRNAFRCCSGLTSVIIPDSVTSIGSEAFKECTSLTSVTIGNGVTTINHDAFALCESLTYIEIPDNVTNIDNLAFYKCSRLTSVIIGNSVENIGGYAFYKCAGLNTVVMLNENPPSVSSNTFEYCDNLEKIIVLKGSREAYINATVWCDCAEIIEEATS